MSVVPRPFDLTGNALCPAPFRQRFDAPRGGVYVSASGKRATTTGGTTMAQRAAAAFAEALS